MADDQRIEDLFNEKNVVEGGNFFKAEKIGDRVAGTLVDKSEPRPNRLKPGTYQVIYSLLQDDGNAVLVAGRMPVEKVVAGVKTKVAIISKLDRLPLGAYVGVAYTEDKEVGQPQPAKILEVYHNGTMKQDKLDEWQGVAPKKEEAPL